MTVLPGHCSRQERDPVVTVRCMAIQVCDHGLYGCGRVIEDRYGMAQMCDYRNHPEFRDDPTKPEQHAPYMRCAVVAEVVGLPMNAVLSPDDKRRTKR